MPVKTSEKNKKEFEIERLKTKAAVLDELMEFIEDKYLGLLMQKTEKEKNTPLARAKKMLRA